MSKTSETLKLEQALRMQARENRYYGCEEVTIGFRRNGQGNEIADFMTMDAEGVFRCYEIKISVADLKSEANLSWYGEYNYLVISEELYLRAPVFDNYIPPYCGILVGEQLRVQRNAKKKPITDAQKDLLKDSLIRSMYWRMDEKAEAADVQGMRERDRTIEALSKELETKELEYRRALFEAQDYEAWYAKNHAQPDFTLAGGARRERQEYAERVKGTFGWNNGRCSACGYEADEKSLAYRYCPICGADLRKV